MNLRCVGRASLGISKLSHTVSGHLELIWTALFFSLYCSLEVLLRSSGFFQLLVLVLVVESSGCSGSSIWLFFWPILQVQYHSNHSLPTSQHSDIHQMTIVSFFLKKKNQCFIVLVCPCSWLAAAVLLFAPSRLFLCKQIVTCVFTSDSLRTIRFDF